jgi:hypothetical protein
VKNLLLFFLSVTALFSTEINLNEKQANFIAQKVWQNEGAGQDKYLVWWNKGEDFASLGIGHFIWFPKGHTERFREVFPMVVSSMLKKGVKIPLWLTPETDFPWQTKEEFIKAKELHTKKYEELFNFLKSTMPYQAEFMAKRLSNALPQMLESIEDEEKKKTIKRRFHEVMHNADGSVNERGLYILLDYTNFKGEGTLKSERYNKQGWGLLQVLWNLDDLELNKQKAFARSASRMLSRRIGNSPPARGEERWRKGWNIRLETYWK